MKTEETDYKVGKESKRTVECLADYLLERYIFARFVPFHAKLYMNMKYVRGKEEGENTNDDIFVNSNIISLRHTAIVHSVEQVEEGLQQ